MITATRLRRIELWSALQCAGGRRVGIWTSVLAAAAVLTLGFDSQLTVQVPLDEPTSATVDRWQVVRVWEDDTAWDEWVITDVTRDDTSSVLTMSAAWPTALLGRTGLVEERTPDGRVRHELDRVGLTPATLLDTLVIVPLVSQGVSWVSRGTVTPSTVRDLSLDWATPLQALTTLAETCGCEVAIRRVGVAGYAIDLLERIGADAPQLDVRAARNLLEFSQAEALSEHATVLTPKGASVDGESATLAENAWRVTAVSGTRVTLADVDPARLGPIAFDAQLDGLRLEAPNGSTVVIRGSTFATQQLECLTAPAVSVDDVVRIVDATGADLVRLPCPPAVRDYGAVAGVLERPDLPGHRNLVPNAVLRDWPTGDQLPTGWQGFPLGGLTLARLTTGPQITRGVSALSVAATTPGAGVATPLAPVAATAARPFVSGYVTLWISAGTVRVELVATTAAGEKVYPLTGQLATSAIAGQQIDLGLAGIDAFAAGITAARLRVVQHSTAPASWIVESAQLTRSAAQLPFVEGTGANALWHAANASLETVAIPRLRTTVRLLDLARLLPQTFGPDCTIRLGATARVVLPRRNIDGTARIVRVEQNLLRPGDGAITLSDAPQDLTGSLARSTFRARPIPAPPIVVLTGDVDASTAFDESGALTILVVGPPGADSLRAAVSTSAIPSASSVDAATGTLRVDGEEVAALTDPGPFAPGVIVYISVRAYQGGVGTRVLQLTDAADAADAAQGPSLEVRTERFDDFVRVRYAAIGVVTYRVNDVLTAVPASPFDVPIPGPGVPASTYVLLCTRNALVQSETIPVFAEDLIYPDVRLTALNTGTTNDRVAFTAAAFDPRDGSAEPSRQLLLTGCELVGFVGAGPHEIAQNATIAILKPFARNDGTIELRSTHPGGGTSRVYRTIPARDLTGVGVEVLSNPEFRSDLPRRAVPYGTLQTLTYGAVSGQNTSGIELVISKAAGTTTAPGSGGFSLVLTRSTASGFVADAYRSGVTYLVTLRVTVPVGYTLQYATNDIGTGSAIEWLSDQQGAGSYRDYLVRVQIGATGSFSDTGYFWITNGSDVAAVTWGVARINWRDLSASERQAPVSGSARIISSDATTVTVQVTVDQATAASRASLSAFTDAKLTGAEPNVQVVSGSTWSFPRKAFRTGAGSAAFTLFTPGFEPAVVTVVIPEQGRDTVSLGLTAERVGGTATTEIVRFMPTDPFPQGTGTLTLSLLPSTASVSPAGPIAMTSGSPTDVTITKPAQSSLPAIVGATLSNPNRVSAHVAVKIEPVRALVPGRVTVVSTNQAGASFEVRFRAYLASGAEVDYLNVGATLTRTPAGGGAPVVTGPIVARDTVNGWFAFDFARTAGDAYSVLIALGEDVGTARTEITVPIPTFPLADPVDTTPRLTGVGTANTATLDAFTNDGNVEIFYTAENAPSGASVWAVFRQGGGALEELDVTAFQPLRTGINKSSSNVGRQRLDGALQMRNAASEVIASASFLSVYYWN